MILSVSRWCKTAGLSISRGFGRVLASSTMALPDVFSTFVAQAPVPVMIHGILRRVFDPEVLDCLFRSTARRQHSGELLYSTVLELMTSVVTRSARSLGSAIRRRENLPVLPKAVYEKIAGLESDVISATLAVTAEELRAVIDELPGQAEPLVPGFRTLVLDGNRLKAVHHRIKPLRGLKLAALPGTCVALLDHRLQLFLRCYLLEDGHASERNVLAEVCRDLQPQDLLLADRNFAVRWFAAAVEDRAAYYLLRQHLSNFPLQLTDERVLVGRGETGDVYEQQALYLVDGESRAVRRITIELHCETRDKESQLHLLTNVPPEQLDAVAAADAYRQRWTIETGFKTMTTDLHCELNTLGYPPAALFGFCTAAMAFNAYSTARAALNSQFGADRMKREVSTYYLADEIRQVWTGMRIAVPDDAWTMAFARLSRRELASVLLELAGHVNLALYKKAPTKPHPPPVKGASSRARCHHASVQKLLPQK